MIFFESSNLVFIFSFGSPNFNLCQSHNESNMKKVTGIGGVFFKAKDSKKLTEWYRENLGMDTNEYGANFQWFQDEEGKKKGSTQWSPFADTTKYFDPSTKEFMINYTVENLEALVAELREAGVTILDDIESYDYGKFVHIIDPEGNKVELWEPAGE